MTDQKQIGPDAAEYLNELARVAQTYRKELKRAAEDIEFRLAELDKGYEPGPIRAKLSEATLKYAGYWEQSARILRLAGVTDIKQIERLVLTAVKVDPDAFRATDV